MSKWATARQPEGQLHELILTEDELQELNRNPFLGPECECLLHGAVIAHGGIIIRATLAELEELQENIAADANHEKNRRRERLRDSVYERIETLFDQEDYYGADFEKWLQDNPEALLEEDEEPDGDQKQATKLEPGSSPSASKSISADVVEKVWQEVAALSPRAAHKLIERMTKEHP